MPQIIPIRDLKNTSQISKMCNESNEPIFITKNGYGDMVIMSIRTYEERMKIISGYHQVLESKNKAQARAPDKRK